MNQMRYLKGSATKVAVLDGLVVLVIVGIVLAVGGVPQSLRTWVLATVGGAALALMTVWRGYRHSQSVLAGTARWYEPALEGFTIGFVPTLALLILPAVNTAIAAGTAYDGAASWGPREWISYLGYALWFSSIFGCIGAAIGSLLSVLNRVLLRGGAGA
jgi:hypothetical protein